MEAQLPPVDPALVNLRPTQEQIDAMKAEVNAEAAMVKEKLDKAAGRPTDRERGLPSGARDQPAWTHCSLSTWPSFPAGEGQATDYRCPACGWQRPICDAYLFACQRHGTALS